jgi:predicted DNA-binding protein
MIKPAKAMTVRLTVEQAEALDTVATVDGLAISEIVRVAISEHIEARKKDPAFQDSLRERLGRAQQLLNK